jgi:hypothetical protein
LITQHKGPKNQFCGTVPPVTIITVPVPTFEQVTGSGSATLLKTMFYRRFRGYRHNEEFAYENISFCYALLRHIFVKEKILPLII